jgi:hypothetical protein
MMSHSLFFGLEKVCSKSGFRLEGQQGLQPVPGWLKILGLVSKAGWLTVGQGK